MAHTWRFARIGGFDQVRIESGADLAALDELDKKLWVALTCPVRGIEIDERTLALVDSDNDGRIHAPELIEAARWATSVVKRPDDLLKGHDALPLKALGNSEEAVQLEKTAKGILRRLEKEEATEIGIADTDEAVAAFNAQPFNGDGVVPPASAEDEAVRLAAEDVLACTEEPTLDRNGEPGISAESLEAFWAAIDEHVSWLDEGATEAIQPLGDASAAAFDALQAVRDKIDDFFARRRIAAYDPRALAAVNREQDDYLTIAAKDLNVTASELTHFPIAQVEADAPLPLTARINPAWAEPMAQFVEKVVVPVLGDKTKTLDEKDWRELTAKFADHGAWRNAERGAAVGKLGAERVRELASSDAKAQLQALIDEDLAEEPAATALESVERIVRYNRDLVTLAKSFVSFEDFYRRDREASFVAGRLFFDERECELCLTVDDAAKHATMAPRSGCFLIYCDLVNSAGDKRTIVAAITQGSIDNIIVGRNGLFFDRKGDEWAATVTKIIQNPISIRQAFWSPYKRVLRFIEEQVEKRAAASEQASQASMDNQLVATKDATAAGTPPPPPEKKKIDVGMVAAIGVAVGGLVAAIGALLQAFFGLGVWMPLGFVVLMLLISGPSMAVAWLKLRKRNLGPLLDANGWAINAQARVNVALGEVLTQEAKIPEGSERDMKDPFTPPSRAWWLWVLLLLLVGLGAAWWMGAVDKYLPERMQSSQVRGK